MADKVASWEFFEGKLSKPESESLKKLPTYTEVLLNNDLSKVQSVINWPSNRPANRLILEKYYIEPSTYPQYSIKFSPN